MNFKEIRNTKSMRFLNKWTMMSCELQVYCLSSSLIYELNSSLDIYIYIFWLEKTKIKLIPLIIAYLHSNVDFEYLYQLFHWIFSIIVLQLHITNEIYIFIWITSPPHSNKPSIITWEIWNGNWLIIGI